MAQILQPVPSFGQEFAKQFTGGLNRGLERGLDFSQQMALQESRQKTEKLDEKRRGYEVGLGSIEAMKTLIPKLGPLESVMSPMESMAARQSYTTYANSLLGILSTIPVRNQKEFEAIKEALSNPLAPQAKIQAAVDSAQDIIQRHMESFGENKEVSRESRDVSRGGKVKFNPQNPQHKAKAKQLHKKYGDVEKVRQELKREFEGIDVE